MRINGEWYKCDDQFTRPIVRGEVLNAAGNWEPTPFLIDTGADCTVLSAALLDVLGFEASSKVETRLGGIGGLAESIEIATSIRLTRDDGTVAVFRGQYSAFTQLESLDISVLGRDILSMFATIVDQPNDVIALIRDRHRYTIEVANR